MTVKVLPFTDKLIVVLVHKCSQQLQLLALHLDMLVYTLGLVNGFGAHTSAYIAQMERF